MMCYETSWTCLWKAPEVNSHAMSRLTNRNSCEYIKLEVEMEKMIKRLLVNLGSNVRSEGHLYG